MRLSAFFAVVLGTALATFVPSGDSQRTAATNQSAAGFVSTGKGDSRVWFAAIWPSDSKRRGRRGACSGEYEENNALDLYENNHAITGDLDLSMSFFSDKHSSDRCMDSEDLVATLDITYKLQGTSSGDADEITVDGTLKKCEEDG